MKNCTYILAVALLSCSSAYSDQTSEPTKETKPQYHRVYVGPDLFVEHAQTKGVSQGDRIDVSSNMVFGGLRAGYDYLKPQAFYFGMDGLVAIGSSCARNRSTYCSSYGPCQVNEKIKTTSLFTNLEQRYGYTFQSSIISKSTLIPFVGIGWYYIRPDIDNISLNWLYGAAGLRVTQQFYENFDVGFNVKAMYSFAGQGRLRVYSKTIKQHMRNTWGYEIGMPFTWHVGESKNWDLQFQPYLLKLDVNSISNIVGARLQAGYSF